MLTLIFLSLLSYGASDFNYSMKTCVDYTKPQEIHDGHYSDGKIHMVPTFEEGGKKIKGYTVVSMPSDSPYMKKGFLVGDIITAIDGEAPPPKAPKSIEKSSKFFEILKGGNFKAVSIERCQKVSLKY